MNDSSWIFTFFGIGAMVWLYIRFYIAVIRIEKHTKETSESLKAALRP